MADDPLERWRDARLLLLVHCEACGRGLLCNGDVVVGGVTAGGDGGDGTRSKVVWGN